MTRFDKIYLEITNICNLSCPFCLKGGRPPRAMQPDEIKSLIPQLKNLADSVCLHVLGEPLCHPEFDWICDLFTLWGLPVQITTNGTLIHQKKKVLLRPNAIRQVNISIHALDAISGNRERDEILGQIYQFCEQALAIKPEMYINLRFWNPAAKDLSPSLQFFRSLFHLNSLSIDLKRKKSFHISGRLYLNFDSQFDWPCLSHPLRTRSGYCYGLTSHFGILANGDVIPCCLDGNGSIALGNGFDLCIENILASYRAEAMRSHFHQGKLIEPLCQRCGFISRFDQKARRLSAKIASRKGCSG